jgi:hypothetical protein
MMMNLLVRSAPTVQVLGIHSGVESQVDPQVITKKGYGRKQAPTNLGHGRCTRSGE